MRDVLLRLLAAIASGVALALSFPPWGLWPLAPLAVAAFTLTVVGRKAKAGFGYGFVMGLVFFAVLLRWLSVIGDDAWIALSIYTAIWLGIVGWGTTLVTRVPGWPIWIALLWNTAEALRGRVPLGGWPWGNVGFSQSDSPLTNLASLGGSPALTVAATFIGGCLAGAWIAGRAGLWRHAVPALAAAAAVLLVGLVIPLPTEGEDEEGPASANIALIQGDVPQTGLGFSDERRAVLDNHVRQTEEVAEDVRAGAAQQPEAVIWPENSSDIDPLSNPDAAFQINQAANAIAAPILVGTVIENPEDPSTVLNLGLVWNPETGPGDRYVKQHPVPFGEYIPFREQLQERIGRFDQIPRDFVPGVGTGVLQVGPVLLGDIICFEVAYGDLVRQTVRDGARMLAIQTNNATYTGSGQTEQQLAMARIRSIEHGRTVAVAATNGISALFAPNGELMAELPESTAGSIVSVVPLRDTLTISDRLSWGPEALAGLATLVALILGFRRRPSVWPVRDAPEAPNAPNESESSEADSEDSVS